MQAPSDPLNTSTCSQIARPPSCQPTSTVQAATRRPSQKISAASLKSAPPELAIQYSYSILHRRLTTDRRSQLSLTVLDTTEVQRSSGTLAKDSSAESQKVCSRSAVPHQSSWHPNGSAHALRLVWQRLKTVTSLWSAWLC